MMFLCSSPHFALPAAMSCDTVEQLALMFSSRTWLYSGIHPGQLRKLHRPKNN